MLNDYLNDWLEQAAIVRNDVKKSFHSVKEHDLNWKPVPTQWSIGELLDHIIITNRHYIKCFEAIAAGGHKPPFGARFGYLSDVFGKSILKSVHPQSTRKLKTVRIFRPQKNRYSTDVYALFDQHQERLIELVKATDFVNHKETFIASPANSIIVYSLHDAVNIVLAHEQRHVAQAKNLLGVNSESYTLQS